MSLAVAWRHQPTLLRHVARAQLASEPAHGAADPQRCDAAMPARLVRVIGLVRLVHGSRVLAAIASLWLLTASVPGAVAVDPAAPTTASTTAAAVATGEPQPDDDGPTPVETAGLQLMNRFRAHPAAECDLVLALAVDPMLFDGVDQQMFAREMRALKPAPPMAFDEHLLAAARNHSRYCILHGQRHDEAPGEGFTGVDDKARAAHAGFTERVLWGEDVFRDARDILQAHASFLIDRGPGGAGGMQPGRGHRSNMSQAKFRLVGLAAVPDGGRLAVTHDFSGSTDVYISGAVFFNPDGAKDYQPGHGRGGVVITASDGSRAVTWASGAYSLRLKHPGDVTLIADDLGLTTRVALAGTGENRQWDWAITPAAEESRLRALIAAVAHFTDPATKAAKRARIALAYASQGLALPDALAREVAAAVGDADSQLAAAQAQARAACARPEGAQALAKIRAPFSGTPAAAWFDEAAQAINAHRAVATAVAGGAAAPGPHAIVELQRGIDACLTTMRACPWRGSINRDAELLRPLVP